MKRAVNGSEVVLDLRYCGRGEVRRRELRVAAIRPVRKVVSLVIRFSVVAALVVMFSKASLVEAFFVPSSSMNPTLRVSDYILVPKFLYGLQVPLVDDVVVSWATPERGDVIVFHQPQRTTRGSAVENQAFVKRVIAHENDQVEIRGNKVFVNGALVEEPYARWVDFDPTTDYHFGPVKVPPGSLFVLGDNRTNSEDSRDWPEHFVPVSHVVGKAIMVYWSSARDSRVRTVL